MASSKGGKKVAGLTREQAAGGVERGKVREILASEMIRKLDPK